jgi:hypothetical protein
MGKKCAITSLPTGRQACTVTILYLKYQDSARMQRRLTLTYFIADR